MILLYGIGSLLHNIMKHRPSSRYERAAPESHGGAKRARESSREQVHVYVWSWDSLRTSGADANSMTTNVTAGWALTDESPHAARCCGGSRTQSGTIDAGADNESEFHSGVRLHGCGHEGVDAQPIQDR